MSNLKSFSEFINESAGAINLQHEIAKLTDELPDKKVFKNCPILKASGRTWMICSVNPDRDHNELKVSYKDTSSSKEKKVNFFDFHSDVQADLLKLIKTEIENN